MDLAELAGFIPTGFLQGGIGDPALQRDFRGLLRSEIVDFDQANADAVVLSGQQRGVRAWW